MSFNQYQYKQPQQQQQKQPFFPSSRGQSEHFQQGNLQNSQRNPSFGGRPNPSIKKTQSQGQLNRKLVPSSVRNRSDLSDFDSQNTYCQKRNQANQLLASGRIQEAFENYEMAMQEAQIALKDNKSLLKEFYGSIMQKQCALGMKFVGDKQYNTALDILFQAQNMASIPKYMDLDIDKLVIVHNNIGCAYKRMQRYQKAEQFLQQALDIINDNQCFDSIGLTYLNICAVSSSANDHDKAYDFAKKALLQCQKQLLEVKSDPILSENNRLVQEKARYAAISYLNLGAEEEYQKNNEQAVEHYQKGQDLLLLYAGERDPLAVKFKNSLAKCKAKVSLGSTQKLSQTRLIRPNSASNKIGKSHSQQYFRNSDTGFSQTPQQQQKKGSHLYFTQDPSQSKLEQTQKIQQDFKNTQASQLRQTIVQRRKEKYESQKKKFPLRQNFQSEYEEDNNNSNVVQQNFSMRQQPSHRKKNTGLSSLERSREISNEREMSDLEKMGVLKWSDSEGSDAENEVMKNKRINFLQSLNNYSKESTSQAFQPQQYQSQTFANNFQKPQYQPPKVLTQSELHKHEVKQEVKEETPKKPPTPEKRKSTIKPKEPEYDEEKVRFIQKRAREKAEKQKRLEEAKKIREEQRLKLEEYRKEKQERERLQREREQEELEQQQQDLEKKRLEDEEEQLKKDIELQKYRNERATFIQNKYREQQEYMEQKNLRRAQRKRLIIRQQQEKFKKIALTIQKNYRMIKAMKEFKMIMEVKRRKERFLTLKKYTKGIKEIKHNFYAEKNTAPTIYFKTILGIKNFQASLDERRLVWKFTKQRGHEGDMEKISMQSLGNDNENRKTLELPLNLKQLFSQKLKEIGCLNLNLELKPDIAILAERVDELIYLKDEELYVEDITDIGAEELQYLQQEFGGGPRKRNISQIKHGEANYDKAATYIQRNYRGYRQRMLYKYKNEKKVKILKSWTMLVSRDLNHDDFIKLFLYQDESERQFFGAKNLSVGIRGIRFQNNLEYTVSLQEKLPRLDQGIIEEILNIEPSDLTMEYSDLAKHINGDIAKQEEEEHDLKLDLATIVKVQARFRQLKAQCNFKLIKELKQKRRDRSERFMVTRRQIFHESIAYNLTLYYQVQKNQIEVTCVPIGKHSFQEKVPMYVQVMFDDFANDNFSNLYFYAPKLLERAYLKRKRQDGEKKLQVPRIEEVMAEIKIKIKKALGEEIEIRDSTVEARMIFNTQRLRMVQHQHKSVISQLENQDFQIQPNDYSKYQDGTNYAQIIQKRYKSFKFRQQYNITKTKNLKHGELNKVDIDDLKAYAMSIQTSTQGYRLEKLEHLEAKKKRIKEEGEIVKPEQKGDKIIEDQIYKAPVQRAWVLKYEKIMKEVEDFQTTERQKQEEELERERQNMLQREGSLIQDHVPEEQGQADSNRQRNPNHKPSILHQKSQEQLEKDRKYQIKNLDNVAFLECNREKYEAMKEEQKLEWWDFDVYYEKEHQKLTVVGLRTFGKEERREVKVLNINLIVLHFRDSKNPVAVKNKIDDIVIKQLRYEDAFEDAEEGKKYGSNLYFEEPVQVVEEVKQEKIVKDLSGAELLAMELAADKSTTVQLQLFDTGFFLVSYAINLKNNILIANVTYKVDTNAKCEIQYQLSQFDCIHLESMVAFKNSEELEKFFYEILKSITDKFIFSVQKNGKDLKIRHNAKKIAQQLPVILQNVFAVRLQNNIKVYRLRKLFTTWLQLMKADFSKPKIEQEEDDRPILDRLQDKQIFIQSFQRATPHGFVQISFFLIRRNFEIKMVLNRHPIRTSSKAKAIYIISLLQLKQQFDLSSRARIKEIQSQVQHIQLRKQKSQYQSDKINYTKEGQTSYKNHPNYKDPADLTEEEWETVLQNVRAAKFEEDPIYLTQNKWMEIQGVHRPNYYRHIYANLLHYLVDNITYYVKYDRIQAEPIDKRIQLIDTKITKVIEQKIMKARSHNKAAEKSVIDNTHCIMMVQSAFKRFKAVRFKEINAESREQREKQFKTIGTRVKRAFVKLQDEYYIINVYQKDNIFSFHLINAMREKKREKKKKEAKIILLKGQYEYDPSKLLNTRDKTIAEYLLDQVELVDSKESQTPDQKEINFKDESFRGIASEKINYIPQDYSKPKFKSQKTIGNIQLDTNSMGEGVPTSIQSNLVDYVHSKDSDGRELLYNVVYTGKKPQVNPRILEEDEDENHGQTVKIDVDLGELKKLYPNVDPQTQDLMKTIGEQLIEGIKIGNQGEIQLDNNKLNPHCLNVSNEKLHHDVVQNQLQSQASVMQSQQSLRNQSQTSQQIEEEEKETENKRILIKNTRFYSKIKYLILIYQVERKVNKIIRQAQDSVFQEYETIYQMCALNMTLKHQDPIIWEITPDEVSQISTGLRTAQDKANYLMKRLQIFNNQVIFIVDQREHLQYVKPKANLVLFYEKGIQPIQLHFRSRTYRYNFNQYKQEINKRKMLGEIIWKGIPQELKSVKTYYLLACFYKPKAKIVEFTAYDMSNYERYDGQVEKEHLKYFYLHREETVRIMSKFFDIDFIEKKLLYNRQVASDFMDKYFKEFREPKTNRSRKYDDFSMGGTTRRNQSGANTKKAGGKKDKAGFGDYVESPSKKPMFNKLNLNSIKQ